MEKQSLSKEHVVDEAILYAFDSQFFPDGIPMRTDRIFGYHQFLRYFLVGSAPGHMLQHLLFTIRQTLVTKVIGDGNRHLSQKSRRIRPVRPNSVSVWYRLK